MLENGYTVPFIARYRKEVTGGVEPTVLHRLKEKMNDCKMLVDKVEKSLQFFSKSGLLTNELSQQLMKCKTSEDIRLLTDPFKSKGPRTLAGRAKAVNLEPIARDILYSSRYVDIHSLAPPEAKKAFTSKTALEDAVSHVIADIFAKDLDIIRKAEELCLKFTATLVTTKKSKRNKTFEPSEDHPDYMCVDSDKSENVDGDCTQNSHSFLNSHNKSKNDLITFKNYLNFSRPVSSILAHQVLAINRASERGVITVKIHLSPQVQHNCATFVSQKYFSTVNRIHWNFVMLAFDDAWKRLLDPHLVRSIRHKLTTSAQDASLDVFTENLRRLLMTAPLRNPFSLANDSIVNNDSDIGMISSASGAPGDRLPVVGLDPGWCNGCKWAACDPHGNVLGTGILWPPHTLSVLSSKKLGMVNGPASNNGLGALTAVMQRHQIETVALGNGQGSRQTGSWLAHLIQIQHFKPLNVRYAVVSECGASYYSASNLACTELPDIDVSFRGAVSIARRLQDPLAELVKMEPKHLGVGMYQHDIPERQLISAVHNVMEECISFVGVDLNAAPLHILSRVAGLSEMKAKAILTYRSQIGPFRSRSDLLKVKGIGQATYAQCAGFVRVKPTYSSTILDGTKDVDMISISSGDDNSDHDLTCDIQVINVSTGSIKRKRKASSEFAGKCKKSRIINAQITDQSDVNCFNPLDQTAVHPDSYEAATNIISLLQFNLTDVGSMKMRSAATKFLLSEDRDKRLEPFCTKTIGLDTLRDIVESLSRPLDFDERQDCFTPLFHSTVMKISDLRKGMEVKGRIENVTTFGAFCDIGVEEDAYIPRHEYPKSCPKSKLAINNTNTLSTSSGNYSVAQHKMFTLRLGDRIRANVFNVDIKYKRISLYKVFIIS
ncbi:S1 RNA-binding domain-containing protein 1 [Schistosoma japonicum]|nr:S1 RNA-binding domain-containing protein 1 [Schistosoma japonicum]